MKSKVRRGWVLAALIASGGYGGVEVEVSEGGHVQPAGLYFVEPQESLLRKIPGLAFSALASLSGFVAREWRSREPHVPAELVFPTGRTEAIELDRTDLPILTEVTEPREWLVAYEEGPTREGFLHFGTVERVRLHLPHRLQRPALAQAEALVRLEDGPPHWYPLAALEPWDEAFLYRYHPEPRIWVQLGETWRDAEPIDVFGEASGHVFAVLRRELQAVVPGPRAVLGIYQIPRSQLRLIRSSVWWTRPAPAIPGKQPFSYRIEHARTPGEALEELILWNHSHPRPIIPVAQRCHEALVGTKSWVFDQAKFWSGVWRTSR